MSDCQENVLKSWKTRKSDLVTLVKCSKLSNKSKWQKARNQISVVTYLVVEDVLVEKAGDLIVGDTDKIKLEEEEKKSTIK